MRVKCPYCEKGFAVYPIPLRQAFQHRRAGLAAAVTTLSVMAVVFVLAGPGIVAYYVGRIMAALTPRLGMGLAATMLTAPFVFLALAVYDRMVPHFGRPVGDELHCVKCGYTLKGLREPRCPECGQSI